MATNKANTEPGESEYSHGRGLQPPERSGATLHGAAPEDWFVDVYDEAKAVQRTDPADPTARADYRAKPRTASNKTETQWVRE